MDERLRREEFWPRLRAALAEVSEEDSRTPPRARVGAVLVLLEDTPSGPRVVLTRRRSDLRAHPGQVSFAGGRLDPDETVEQAALREAEEEIGLRSETVEVLGTGSAFYIPPSRFWVVPVVARWRDPHPLDPNPWEVDEILRVALETLLDRDRWRHVPLPARGSSWAWELSDDLVWGATAIVLSLLLDVAVESWSAGLAPEDLGPDRAVRPWRGAPGPRPEVRLRGDLPVVAESRLAFVTAAQMRAVHERLSGLGLSLAARAEQAGRAVAEALRHLDPSLAGEGATGGGLAGLRVTVLTGPGRTGAGGLAAARLLDAAGAAVEVLLAGEPRLPAQVAVLSAAGIEPIEVTDGSGIRGRRPGAVVVDAVLGLGIEPPLRDAPAALADWLRRHDVPVLALELPSGLAPDTGPAEACVAADVTVTLAAPKVGLRSRLARAYVGDLYLADLGVPRSVWEAVGVPAPDVFGTGPLVRLLPDTADHPEPERGG